jgi:hypothetical protein
MAYLMLRGELPDVDARKHDFFDPPGSDFYYEERGEGVPIRVSS